MVNNNESQYTNYLSKGRISEVSWFVLKQLETDALFNYEANEKDQSEKVLTKSFFALILSESL